MGSGEVGQEAICEEILVACQSGDCSRLMYGMRANAFRILSRVLLRATLGGFAPRSLEIILAGRRAQFSVSPESLSRVAPRLSRTRLCSGDASLIFLEINGSVFGSCKSERKRGRERGNRKSG